MNIILTSALVSAVLVLPDNRKDNCPFVQELAYITQFVRKDWTITSHFDEVEQHIKYRWEDIIEPFLEVSNGKIKFSAMLDFVVGHGRNPALLLPLLGHLHIVDISVSHIEVCRLRSGSNLRRTYEVNDGYSLPLPDNSLSFSYCLDAMVHFDSDVVRAYLREFRRTLRSGGCVFSHHSNDTRFPYSDLHHHPHLRNFISLNLLVHYAYKEELKIVRQQPLDWSYDGDNIEGHSLFTLP